MIGIRCGIIPVRAGVRGGTGTVAGGGSAIPGVTRDANNNVYSPANATEWTAFRAATGAGLANPTSVWPMQEASGTLVDTIGGVNLAQSGTGHLYQQTTQFWSRKVLKTIDGTVGQKWINSTTAPDPATTSTLWLLYSDLLSAGAAARCVMATNASLDFRVTGPVGKVQGINGSTVTGVENPLFGPMPLLIKHDNTNSVFTLYTAQERLSGTYAPLSTAPVFAFGGQTAAAGDFEYAYGCMFTGAAAELSDNQVRSLLLALGWFTVW